MDSSSDDRVRRCEGSTMVVRSSSRAWITRWKTSCTVCGPRGSGRARVLALGDDADADDAPSALICFLAIAGGARILQCPSSVRLFVDSWLLVVCWLLTSTRGRFFQPKSKFRSLGPQTNTTAGGAALCTARSALGTRPEHSRGATAAATAAACARGPDAAWERDFEDLRVCVYSRCCDRATDIFSFRYASKEARTLEGEFVARPIWRRWANPQEVDSPAGILRPRGFRNFHSHLAARFPSLFPQPAAGGTVRERAVPRLKRHEG